MVAKRPVFTKKPSLHNNFLKQTSCRQLSKQSTISITVNLPPYVLPHYWAQYALSMSDIAKQSEHIPAKLYWIAALLYGIDVCASAVKPSYSCRDHVIIMNKSTAIKKIIKSQKITLSKTDKIVSSKIHIPQAPAINLSKEDMDALLSMETHQLKIGEVRGVSSLFTWKDLQFLPVGMDGSCIVLKRVVLASDFQKSGKQQSSGYATRPLLFHIHNKPETIYALAEDIVFVG